VPDPKDYVHILAWGKMMHSEGWYVRTVQDKAAKDGAPLDAVYEDHGKWITVKELTSQTTRWCLQNALKDLASMGIKPKLELIQGGKSDDEEDDGGDAVAPGKKEDGDGD
jgi:hypothetical protein